MKLRQVFPAWGAILAGRKPFLSIEITRECPLRCPGCYVYELEHLNGAGPVRDLTDYRGAALIDRVLTLVQDLRPLHVSIVGGEPLVRYRELNELLPRLDKLGVEVQLVTSAVRPIPADWAELGCLHLVVSVDGLAPEHDRRRAPATYDRLLAHIAGHRITVHCTVTRQMLVARDGYLEEFAAFWSARPEVQKIWFSLFTPQDGTVSAERLTPADRAKALVDLEGVARRHRKVYLPKPVLDGLRTPPASPEECIFAQATTCYAADLTTRVAPCQFGGTPVCSECGCMASAGLAAIGRYRLAGLVPVSALFGISRRVGERRTRARVPADAAPKVEGAF